METVRESPLGQLLRWITGNRIFLYSEERTGFSLDSKQIKWKTALSRNGTDCLSGNRASRSSEVLPSSTAHARLHPPRSQEMVENLIVDWYGPQDPSNPRNWSSSKKKRAAFIICLYTFVVYCGSSIYVPAESQIMEHFQVGATKSSLGLALYVLGYGIGPLFFSPLSEIPAMGRNIPYIVSFLVFVLLCIPASLVDNYAGLMVLRFLQGFFGSPCLASGGASMADMYSDTTLPLSLTGWVAAAYGGPALGPLLSSFAIVQKGWRWSLWEILWMSGPVFCIMLVLLPETSADTILLHRAQRLRVVTSNHDISSPSEMLGGATKFQAVLIPSLVKPIEIMVKDPAILFTNLYTSLVYGIYYSFFEAFPLVYPSLYGFDLGETGLIFLSLAVACGLGAVVYIIYLYTYLIPDLEKHGHRSPEHRLLPAVFASILPPIGLLIFAWTSRQSIHWIVSAVGILTYAASVFIIFQCVFVYIPLVYPRYAASLFAGNDFSRSAVAFAFILFSRDMFLRLGVAKGVSLLAGLSVLGFLGMLALYLNGAKLRSRSRFTGA